MNFYRTLSFILLTLIVITTILASVKASYSEEENSFYYKNDNIVIEFKTEGEVEVIKKKSSGFVDELTAELFFIPINDERQTPTHFETNPQTIKKEESIIYEWIKPDQNVIKYSLDSTIRTNNIGTKVKESNFPLGVFSGDLSLYLKETELMDYNYPEIRRIASEIATNEDDEFVIASEIAFWIQENIQYNLSTLTADASLPASWVIDNRQGVCDEITNLYIAMLRSLGIPAKFVAGYSYTDSPLFSNNWGAHGWAEVYFPEYGWVPFDITYRQYGHVDGSHIKLRETYDSDRTSVKYTWSGKDIEIKTLPLKFEAEIISKGDKINDGISITVNPIEDEVGLNSFNVIEAEIENTNDYYIATEVYLSQSEGIKLHENIGKRVVLKPKEKKKVYWLIEVENLDDDFIYTFFFEVYTLLDSKHRIEMKVDSNMNSYSKDYMTNQIKEVTLQEETYGAKLFCRSDKNRYFIDDNITIKCQIENLKDYDKSFELCINGSCKDVSVSRFGETTASIVLNKKEPGHYSVQASINEDDKKISNFIQVIVNDNPNLKISELNYPNTIEYDENVELNFKLSKDSFATPQDVEVVLNVDGRETTLNLGEVNNEKVKFTIESGSFASKNPKISIIVKYQGIDNIETTEETFNLQFDNLTFWQRVNLFLNKITNVFS